MTRSPREIEVKDLEAQEQRLKKSIKEKKDELQGLVLDIELKKMEVKQFTPVYETFDKTKADFSVKTAESEVQKEQMRKEKEAHAAVLKSINREIRDSTKQLTKLNESCLNGKSEIEFLKTEKESLSKDIGELHVLVLKKEAVIRDTKTAEVYRDKVILETNAITERANAHVQVSRQTLDMLAIESAEAIKKRDDAQQRAKEYSDSLFDKMADYELVKSRLKEQFSNQYPELKFPLE